MLKQRGLLIRTNEKLKPKTEKKILRIIERKSEQPRLTSLEIKTLTKNALCIHESVSKNSLKRIK